MAFYNTKQIRYQPLPIPDEPGYVPPVEPIPPAPAGGSIPDIPRDIFTGTTNVTFYKVYEDSNNMNKKLENGVTFSITFKNATSVHTPVLVIEANVDLSKYNYAYIESINRYYFIESVELVPGNVFQISLKCDVLMSFKDGIRACIGILKKTQLSNYANYDLNDGSFTDEAGSFTEVIVYDDNAKGFLDTPHRVLVVVGGV